MRRRHTCFADALVTDLAGAARVEACAAVVSVLASVHAHPAAPLVPRRTAWWM